MLNYHVKIGLVPIRRDVTPRPGIFNWEKAEERCAAAVARSISPPRTFPSWI